MRTWFLLTGLFLTLCLLALQLRLSHSDRPTHIPCLVWATDDNPVRQQQMALFREWHLQTYHQPIDIRIDPANADSAKIIVQSFAGAGPDLFDYVGPTSLRTYVESGVTWDISPYAQPLHLSPHLFWPALHSTLTYDNIQYAVPANTVTHTLLANLDIFENANVPLPQPGWNWDDFLRIGSQLTQRDSQNRITRFAAINLDPRQFILQNGGQFFNPSATRSIFNSPQTIQALQFFQDLSDTHHLTPTPGEQASLAGSAGYGGYEMNLFLASKSAMFLGGRYHYIAIQQINLERAQQNLPPLRIVPLPPLSQKQTASLLTARAVAINRHSPQKHLALRFLQFLASPTYNQQVHQLLDALPSLPPSSSPPDSQPTTTSTSTSDTSTPGENHPIWLQTAQQGIPYPDSPFLPGSQFQRIVSNELERFTNHLQSASETAQRIESQLNQAIDQRIAQHPALRSRYQQLTSPSNTPTSSTNPTP